MAQRALEAIRGDLARGGAGLPPALGGLPDVGTLALAWLERRESTHRNWRRDRNRWHRDLAPTFARLRPPAVTQAVIRAWCEGKLAAGLSPASVRLGVRLLSSLWSDLAERPRDTGVTVDPTKRLPRSLRRLLRPTSDPRLVPYLRTAQDVRRVFDAMPSPARVAFAVGALAGLRTGEVIGLSWGSVDLEHGRLTVREQVQNGEIGPLKDDEARFVPLSPQLAAVLKAYRLETGGRGLLFPPARPGRRSGPGRIPARFIRPQTLAAALRATGEVLTWYQATRHTFASHRAQVGVPLATLAAWLGHSSVLVTQRYAHLQPHGEAAARDVAIGAPDLLSPRGRVSRLPAPENGQRTGRVARHAARARRADARNR
jgi:integrase